MAMISKIRNRAGLLIGIVGFSLVAFVLGDFLTSNRSFLSGNDTSVGVIAGKKTNVQDFEARVQKEIENYKLSNNTDNIDQNTTDQLRDQTWNQLISEEVMGTQYKKLGITVGPDEVFDMVKGKNPHPQVVKAFTDPKTGQFNPANVINFLKNMDNDQTGKTRTQWVNFEKYIQDERIGQKYNDLIKHGLFITAAEAKEDYINKNKTASVKYVMLNYGDVADSTVEVSDDDLKKVYEEYKTRYKQGASRGIDYVIFEVQPSEVDRKSSLESITRLKEEFQASADDTSYVAANSDGKMDKSWHKKGTLPFNIDSLMFNNEMGFVYGPYEEGGAYKLAKLSDIKFLPDSVKARHILLKIESPDQRDAVMAKADSIKKAIQGGTPFVFMAMQFSTDEGSKIKGGDLGWFQPGMMVQSFNDACFEGKKGDMPIVESQFGVHLIEILDQGKPSKQVKVAIIERKAEPSNKTYQAVFQKANEFAGKNTTAEAFDKAIKDQNLNKLTETNIQENARQVGGVEGSKELIRWAFKASKNEVSKAFEFGDKFVVAKLIDIREKGIAPLDQVKDEVMVEARKNKKAEMMMKKFEGAGGNIETIASKIGQQVLTAENVNFSSPLLGNSGMEPKVVGHIFAMKPGTASKPIQGQSGVYVVQVTGFKDPAPIKDYKEVKKQLEQQVQGRSQYEVFNALREKADITDNRGRFY